MSRKTFIIIVAVLVLFLLALLGYFFLTRSGGSGTEETKSGFSFFPFGNKGGSESDGSGQNNGSDNNNGANGGNGSGTNGKTEPLPVTENFTKRLRKISVEPVSGLGTVDLKVGTVIRYIEKATGHIYDVETFSPKIARISNTTIPLSYDAIWGSRPEWLMARYLEDDNQTVSTYSLNIKLSSTTAINTTSGIVFPENITDVSVFGDKVFYLTRDFSGSKGFVSGMDGKNKKQIWNSEIKEFNSQFVNARTVALTTRPHQGIPGFIYLVDTENASVKKILGNINGLSGLVSPDLTKVLYSEFGGNTSTKIWTDSDKKSVPVDLFTFPEKCVWSRKDKNRIICATPKDSLYDDGLTSWYKGKVSTNDELFSINLRDNGVERLVDFQTESGEKIDLIKPTLSDNEQYLVFINKIDNSLWSLDLTKTTSVSTSSIPTL